MYTNTNVVHSVRSANRLSPICAGSCGPGPTRPQAWTERRWATVFMRGTCLWRRMSSTRTGPSSGPATPCLRPGTPARTTCSRTRLTTGAPGRCLPTGSTSPWAVRNSRSTQCSRCSAATTTPHIRDLWTFTARCSSTRDDPLWCRSRLNICIKHGGKTNSLPFCLYMLVNLGFIESKGLSVNSLFAAAESATRFD